MSKRNDFVKKALSWVGTKEGSKGHAQIVADYNKACDKGRKADTNSLWCALFVGAVAQETDNVLTGSVGVPVDYSCGKGSHSLIEKARAANSWVEDDAYEGQRKEYQRLYLPCLCRRASKPRAYTYSDSDTYPRAYAHRRDIQGSQDQH